MAVVSPSKLWVDGPSGAGRSASLTARSVVKIDERLDRACVVSESMQGSFLIAIVCRLHDRACSWRPARQGYHNAPVVSP